MHEPETYAHASRMRASSEAVAISCRDSPGAQWRQSLGCLHSGHVTSCGQHCWCACLEPDLIFLLRFLFLGFLLFLILPAGLSIQDRESWAAAFFFFFFSVSPLQLLLEIEGKYSVVAFASAQTHHATTLILPCALQMISMLASKAPG